MMKSAAVLLCGAMALSLMCRPAAAQSAAPPAQGAATLDWKAMLDIPPDDQHTQVVRILRTTNKAQINRYAGKVYTFQYANPGQINNFFTSAIMREEGAIYTFVPPEGPGGKIFVICPAYQIPYFDQLAKDLDRPKLTSAPGSKYIYKQMKHRNILDAAFVNVARQYASPNAVLEPDTETNAIMIFDSPSGSDYCANALDKYLDVATPNVNVKVKIYEVSVNNDGSLGLDYEAFRNGPYQNMLVGTAGYNTLEAKGTTSGYNTATRSADLSRTNSSRYGLIDLQYPSAYFDFLVEKGKARVATETQLVTASSKAALLTTGEQVLYYSEPASPDNLTRTVTGDKAQLARAANPYGMTVQAVNTGLSVSLTPVIADQSIQLTIEASAVSILSFREDGLPMLNSRRAVTDVTVKNGQEIILGGLTRERQGKGTYKVPVLGNIPVLGWLFGGEKNVSQKTMMVMVVQPTIDTTFKNVGDAEKRIIAQASGDQAVEIPKAAFGFDMFLFDSEP